MSEGGGGDGGDLYRETTGAAKGKRRETEQKPEERNMTMQSLQHRVQIEGASATL
jgi:hypothetical protein